MALDTLVLRLKSLGVDNIFTFPYVKVPDKKALEQSVETLQMIGGLSEDKTILLRENMHRHNTWYYNAYQIQFE